MRYHHVYNLVDPRYRQGDPRYIRYVGHTSRKLEDELQWLLSNWPNEGGPKRHLLSELSSAGVEPVIIAVDKFQSASEAKERVDNLVQYCEGQGYELVNSQLDSRCTAWDRQRVIEDFQIEVMRLLLGQESPYERALRKLEEEGERNSALYLYLQSAETPSISVEEIPGLFREHDERVKGLEYEVIRAIDSGEIRGPITGILVEAIEESRRSVAEEEGSALECYARMAEEQGDESLVFYLGKEPSTHRREKTERKLQEAREAGWKGFQGVGREEPEKTAEHTVSYSMEVNGDAFD